MKLDPPSSLSVFEKFRWFQKTAIGISFLFFLALFISTLFAYSRRSGSTGMDVVRMHEMRMRHTKEVTAWNSNETERKQTTP